MVFLLHYLQQTHNDNKVKKQHFDFLLFLTLNVKCW